MIVSENHMPICIIKGFATRHEKQNEHGKSTYLDYLEDVEEFQKDRANNKSKKRKLKRNTTNNISLNA